ncbi:MAG: tripartite tricarboxylate transporter TctB family protein [Comamonas sp.]|nr:tripartite tricarboxylate transporter TctB family protein [Comamonas sp.]
MAGIFVSIVGLFFALVGTNYNFGTASRMGPGYMPVVLGWILFILGILIMLPAFFRKGERIEVHWDSLLAATVSLVVFAFILNTLGVFLSTIISVLIASVPKRMHFGIRGIIAISIAVITSLIFIAGLEMSVSLFPTL